MIAHEVKTRHNHITYYYATAEQHLRALYNQNGDYGAAMVQMAHTIYDHTDRRFVKEREGNCELMNAMLIVERRRGNIPTELFDMVREHA